MRLHRPSPAALSLGLILAAASATRFSWLDLMEFKGDEANACRLALHVLGYSEPGVGRFFPTAGLVSSVGVPNPPLFVYLIAVPLAVVRSPIAAVALVAAANVLAVWLTFEAGKRCFSRFVGFSSAALMALSPWGIVFSRKIWAQDLLPLCTTLFLLQLHALVVKRKPRAAGWLIVIAAVATQLHFSAWILVPVAAAAIICRLQIISGRAVLGGAAVAAALYAPFLVFHTGQVVHAVIHRESYRGPGAVGRLEAATRLILAIVSGGHMSFLLGSGSSLASFLSPLLGVGAALGLAAPSRRFTPQDGGLRGLLLLWYLQPLVLLTLLPVHSYIHYFIILLPLPYLGVARLVELLIDRKQIAAALIAACLCAFGLLDAHFFRTIVRDGGAPGQYGVGYRYKQAAAQLLKRENPSQTFRLGTSASFNPSPLPRPYRFLIWNLQPNRSMPTGRPTTGYILINTLQPRLAQLRLRPQWRRYKLGPLTVVAVPLHSRASDASGS